MAMMGARFFRILRIPRGGGVSEWVRSRVPLAFGSFLPNERRFEVSTKVEGAENFAEMAEWVAS